MAGPAPPGLEGLAEASLSVCELAAWHVAKITTMSNRAITRAIRRVEFEIDFIVPSHIFIVYPSK
jgi:hypothetical protein